MPHYPVLQPNGNLAIWSTIIDSLVAVDLTVEQAARELASWHAGPNLTYCRAVANGSKPFGWWKSWVECLGWMIAREGESDPDIQYAVSITSASDMEGVHLYEVLIRAERAADDARFAWEDWRKETSKEQG